MAGEVGLEGRVAKEVLDPEEEEDGSMSPIRGILRISGGRHGQKTSLEVLKWMARANLLGTKGNTSLVVRGLSRYSNIVMCERC